MAQRHVRLLLCRHTQTDLNAQGRYSGAREDTPLNAVGELQADHLAETIARLPITAIWSSDLLRTRQVASRVALQTGLTVTHDASLREVDIGDIGTMAKEEALVQFPDAHFRTSSPCYDYRTIGGESREQVIERQLACFNDILAQHGALDHANAPIVVVVGHGTALRTMLEHLHTGLKLHEQGDHQIITYST